MQPWSAATFSFVTRQVPYSGFKRCWCWHSSGHLLTFYSCEMLFQARLSCVSNALSYLTMEFLFYHRQCKHASTSPWSPEANVNHQISPFLPHAKSDSAVSSSPQTERQQREAMFAYGPHRYSPASTKPRCTAASDPLHLHLTRGKPMTARESSSFQLLPVFLLISGDHPLLFVLCLSPGEIYLALKHVVAVGCGTFPIQRVLL